VAADQAATSIVPGLRLDPRKRPTPSAAAHLEP